MSALVDHAPSVRANRASDISVIIWQSKNRVAPGTLAEHRLLTKRLQRMPTCCKPVFESIPLSPFE
jgi:hypothetical protein